MIPRLSRVIWLLLAPGPVLLIAPGFLIPWTLACAAVIAIREETRVRWLRALLWPPGFVAAVYYGGVALLTAGAAAIATLWWPWVAAPLAVALATVMWRRHWWPAALAVATSVAIGPLLYFYGHPIEKSVERAKAYPDIELVLPGDRLSASACGAKGSAKSVCEARKIKRMFFDEAGKSLYFSILFFGSTVAEADYASLGRVDLGSGRLDWWPEPHAFGLAYDAARGSVYAALETGAVAEIDLKSLKTRRRFRVAPHRTKEIFYDPSRDRLVVTGEDGYIEWYDTASSIPHLSGTAHPTTGRSEAAYDSLSETLYVANIYPLMPDWIVRLGELRNPVTSGGGNFSPVGVGYVPERHEFWSADMLNGNVFAYNVPNRQTRKVTRLRGGIRELLPDPGRKKVYICEFFGTHLYAIDTDSGALSGTYSVGPACRAMALGPDRQLYVANALGVSRVRLKR